MQTTQVSKSFSQNDVAILVIAMIFFLIAGFINQKVPKPVIQLTKQDSALNLNRNLLLIFNLGNKRLISDVLWVQTLLESDEEHYKQKDLNSWMYLRFMGISALDPMFYENYMYGGLYLSIVKDDVLGASNLFEKGIQYYPVDYKLRYYAGFNYYFEQGEIEKGRKYLESIQDHADAPTFIKTIVAKLKFETSRNFEHALDFLKVQYNDSKDEGLRKKLLGDIYALQAELDLECLNSGKKDCQLKDIDGQAYIKESGTWKAPKIFIPYRARQRQR